MKKKKLLLITIAVISLCGGLIIAADHIDSPAVTNQPSDITDLYVFRAANPDNLVFVGNTQGLLSPASTANAKFDENTMIEFNIDNNGDHVEDLVIQCIAKNGMMKVYGPFKPSVTGTTSYLGISHFTAQVEITPYGQPAIMAEQKGVRLFAGPRDDPFFFDLVRFRQIIAGTATAFNNPGHDTFAGTNVLGLVLEIPKSMLGGNGTIDVWAETKKRTDTQ